MRIGIDARLYGPKQGGLGRYVQKLIENLEKIDFKNQYFIFLRKENFGDYQPRNKNFKKVLFDVRWYSLKEQIFFPFVLYFHNLDLVHFPHFNVPIFYFKKIIVTVHDLTLFHFPDRRATTLPIFLFNLKFLFSKVVLKTALKRAKKIITVSEFVKQDLIKNFNLRPEKIIVTYEAAERQPATNNQQLTILRKFNITQPYLLYVGAAYPHKNLERLLKVFEILGRTLSVRLSLVLVGKEDFFYRRLKEWAKKNLEPETLKSIIFTGFTSDQELAVLYRNALIYVFPSYCEGFGLPGLEAMNYNLPVVAANSSSLPEIFGSAAIYFNPFDIQEMARVLKRVIEDKKIREEMVERGEERIKNFSWLECAKKTLDVYKS